MKWQQFGVGVSPWALLYVIILRHLMCDQKMLHIKKFARYRKTGTTCARVWGDVPSDCIYLECVRLITQTEQAITDERFS
jgi:hypothetical protein